MNDKFDRFRKIFGAEVVNNFLSKLGLGPGIRLTEPEKHLCPLCGKKNAYFREMHPDTDINEVVLCCPDCGWRDDGEIEK